MPNLEEQYNKIISYKKEINAKINGLLNNEKVKEYLELLRQLNKLDEQQKEFYKLIKIKEYSSCNHIWVTALHDYDSIEGRSYNYCGCIKCGLDRKVFHIIENYHNLDWLTFDQRIMYDFMKNNHYYHGIDTKVQCDLDLAKAIYTKIKEVHPNIDDKTARKYFEIALDNIRHIKVSHERKINRAKRLNLSPNFNKWKALDVRKI